MSTTEPAARVQAWVEASCHAQGLPVKVEDPAVLRRVAVLIGVSPKQPKGKS